MRILGYAFCLLALSVGCGLAQAEGIGWQEAVARLAHERTRAESCVRLLKIYGNEVALSQGDLTYGEAKAEVDAVIAGLVVALAKDAEPQSLPDLEARLERGIKGREAFCAEIIPLLPNPAGTSHEKGILDDLVAGALGPLIEAVKEIYLDYRTSAREVDHLTRITIQNQLEATKCPPSPTFHLPTDWSSAAGLGGAGARAGASRPLRPADADPGSGHAHDSDHPR
jgi:hypothetical protein